MSANTSRLHFWIPRAASAASDADTSAAPMPCPRSPAATARWTRWPRRPSWPHSTVPINAPRCLSATCDSPGLRARKRPSGSGSSSAVRPTPGLASQSARAARLVRESERAQRHARRQRSRWKASPRRTVVGWLAGLRRMADSWRILMAGAHRAMSHGCGRFASAQVMTTLGGGPWWGQPRHNQRRRRSRITRFYQYSPGSRSQRPRGGQIPSLAPGQSGVTLAPPWTAYVCAKPATTTARR